MSPDTLYVEQGGETHEVTPLGDGGQSVGSFYGYDQAEPASADTGLERSGVSQMFFYEGSGGTSLVFLHDEPDDGSGGSASVSFGSAPSGLSWVVKDDPFDSGYSSNGADWDWAPCCTDGGAVRGGLDGEFRMSVSGSFSGIGSWVFRDGSGGTFALDMGEPVTLASREPTQELPEIVDFSFGFLEDVDTNIEVDMTNLGEYSRRECQNLGPGTETGETPLLLNVDLVTVEESISFDFENFQRDVEASTSQTVWIGVDPETKCLWAGLEEPVKVCEQITCRQTAGPLTLAEARELAAETEEFLNEQGISDLEIVGIVIVLAILALFASAGVALGGLAAAALAA